jgi:polyhydroxyalkanoate synthesis repressor PhaR
MKQEKIVIKKYRNRRLYDMAQKRYITMEELTERIREGCEVQVLDSTTGEDITQAVLIQIILDSQKASGYNLFSNHMLHQLIQYRDQSTADFFQKYLPSILDGYLDWQRQTQSHFMNWAKLGWSTNPFSSEMFNPGMAMWGMGRGYNSSREREEGEEPDADTQTLSPEEVDALKKRIEELENLLKKSRKRD